MTQFIKYEMLYNKQTDTTDILEDGVILLRAWNPSVARVITDYLNWQSDQSLKPGKIIYLTKSRCYGLMGSLVLSAQVTDHAKIIYDRRCFDRIWIDSFGYCLAGDGQEWKMLGVSPERQPPIKDWLRHSLNEWRIDIDATCRFARHEIENKINKIFKS